jgi:pimeloyl-ACP methyl ester carboxylesterase
MLDARNHGRSDSGPASPALLAADVAAVMCSLGLDRSAVIGHSVGAHTAALLAAERPDAVSRLVLEDPPWTTERADDDERATQQVRTWLASLGAMTRDEIAALGRSQHGDWPDAEFPAWIESNQQVRPEAADGLASGGWVDTVGAIACPTLLVYGDVARGGMVTAEAAATITAANCNITACPIDDAGHNLHRENFDAFIEHVGGFLRGA